MTEIKEDMFPRIGPLFCEKECDPEKLVFVRRGTALGKSTFFHVYLGYMIKEKWKYHNCRHMWE